MDGTIKRTSVFVQPMYFATYKNVSLSISFYSDSLDKKKVDYINYNLALISKNKISIKNLLWLKKMGAEITESSSTLIIDKFLIENISDKNRKQIEKNNNYFAELLNDLQCSAYILINETGLLTETISAQIIVDTLPDTHIRYINRLFDLFDFFNRRIQSVG